MNVLHNRTVPFYSIKPGDPDMFKDRIMVSIAKSHGKTVAQVALRFLLQRGLVVIPKSYNPDRQRENIDVSGTSFCSHSDDALFVFCPDEAPVYVLWADAFLTNFQVYDFTLTDDEMTSIYSLNRRFMVLDDIYKKRLVLNTKVLQHHITNPISL